MRLYKRYSTSHCYWTKDNIEDNQREYYLKERLKAIQEELGENESISDEINESKFLNHIVYKSPLLSNATSNFTNSIREAYELGIMVSNKEITTNEADLKNLDFMLKYGVVDRKTVEKLKDMGKLNINNIDSVLSNY